MKNVNLALWGPSAAGKTALLAQLFDRPHVDWDVFPTPESLPFIERMQPILQSNNLFPPATMVANHERIVYLFRHRQTGATATLHVEDRAGTEFEEMNVESQQHLSSADGLVLLFDPQRDRQKLSSEVQLTLRRLHVISGRGAEKDPRPIAVCLSKADLAIHGPDDLRRVHEDPEGFVRDRMVAGLEEWIDRFCLKFRLFPVSAAGVRVRRGVVEPVVFYDELLRFRIGQGGAPVNLLEPFLWVFQEVERAS
jgi:Double-GTPase 2